MNYKVTTDINSEKSGTTFMDVGIHENCELGRRDKDEYPIVFGKTDKGNQFLAFYFVNANNEELSHTEWQPSDIDNDAQKLEVKTLNQIKRVKHIATKFISEDDFVFESDNFEDFALKTIEKIDDNYKDIKVRLKVVYSNSNYTSLPNYVPFIETMDVTEEKTRLKMLSIDKVVRDEPDRETPSETNPFNTETTDDVNQQKDDTPF